MKKLLLISCMTILSGCDFNASFESYPTAKYTCPSAIADQRAKFIMDCVKEMQVKFLACESASIRIYCDEIPEKEGKNINQTETTIKNE